MRNAFWSALPSALPLAANFDSSNQTELKLYTCNSIALMCLVSHSVVKRKNLRTKPNPLLFNAEDFVAFQFFSLVLHVMVESTRNVICPTDPSGFQLKVCCLMNSRSILASHHARQLSLSPALLFIL